MTCTITVPLKEPATEITREEILKQVAHLSDSVRRPRIPPDGSRLEFDVLSGQVDGLQAHAERLCSVIQRSLRRLERKVVYQTRSLAHPVFRGTGASVAGVHPAGTGQVMLEGLPLRLFEYFDTALGRLERHWKPHPLLTPTLIPATVLARCDYFRSFPHTVTFACHLRSEAEVINAFRVRHENKSTVDEQALADMAQPEACLSPAVCYHVYHRDQGATLPANGKTYCVRGKCFRYEASNLRDLRRLWDFTMRELVFLGTADRVLEERQRCVEVVGTFLDELGLAAEIRTASDPFYIAPDASSKTYFQLTAETKFEVSALMPGDERLAIASLNYHTDFFGRAFDINIEGAGPAHSTCIGFGLERCVSAFLAQHGAQPEHWPAQVRNFVLAGPD